MQLKTYTKSIIQTWIEEVIHRIVCEKRAINNKELLRICGGTENILREEINPHFYHEIAETALNEVIKRKYLRELLTAKTPAKLFREIIEPLTEKLPTQTWRSNEQNKWQQFSTPPGIAYLLAYLLNLRQNEQVLEPSAGTGSLAVWPSELTIKTHTNEIDGRRKLLLEFLGFEPTGFNAEFIHDYLPGDIEPDCLMMNPPFSSSGGRTKNNSSKFGFRHVESALERLKEGGKFGIILGKAGGLDTKTGNDFWRKLSDRIEVKSIIKIDGREYYKNGTTVDINLITGKKHLEPRKTDWHKIPTQISRLSVNTVKEAFEKVIELNLRLNQ
jgi:hypothetical protein